METLSRRNKKPNPRSKASFLSRITFWYLNPLFHKGSKTDIEVSDIHATSNEYASSNVGAQMQRQWEVELAKTTDTKQASLSKALARENKQSILQAGILFFLIEALRLTSAYVTGFVVEYFVLSSTITKRDALLYAGGCVLAFIIATILWHWAFFSVECLGLKLKTGLTSLVYKKAIGLSQVTLPKTTDAQIANLISSDAQNIVDAMHFFNYLWIAPVQIIAVTVMIYFLIGISVFPGTGVMIFIVLYQIGLGNIFALLRSKIVAMTDERVKLMREVVKGMHAIKLYSWEEPFINLLKDIGSKEMKNIHHLSTVRAFNIASFITMPYVCALVMFATHYMLGETLTVSKVFSTLALLQAVRVGIAEMFSSAIQCSSEANISCGRIQKFLELEEGKSELVISKPLSKEDPRPYVIVKNANAAWNMSAEHPTLQNIHFDLNEAKPLLIIVGPVGAGKSSVLMSLCGELPLIDGSVRVNGTISYATQQPWIFSGTVKQNILFGLPYDAEKYESVVNACALIEDFRQLPESDLTVIGDRGACISGAQKTKISLARAVYRDAEIYLLDDPLCALETKVGRHIFEHCINGILKDKIRILCTRQIQQLKFADQILTIQEGKQINVATPEEWNRMRYDMQSLLSEGSFNDKEWDRDSAIDFEEVKLVARKPRLRTGSSVSGNSPPSMESKVASKINHSYIVDEPSSSHVCHFVKLAYQHNDSEDAMMEGNSTAAIYVKYLKAGGGIVISLLVFLICIISQLCLTGADWWLGNWSNAEELKSKNRSIVNSKYYFHDDNMNNLYLYIGLILLALLMTMFSSLSFFWLAVNSSKTLHDKMLQAILKATLYFFNSTPLGRILYRFSKDTYVLDEEMPCTFYDIVHYGFFIINAIVISVVNVPYMLIILVPIAIAFLVFRSYYMQTARDVKRLEAASLSPMFAHLSATLEGITTIRASNSIEKVTEEFFECQDHRSEAWYLFISTARWFSIRLEIMLVLFISISIFAPFVVKEFTDTNSTLVGLTLIYCLQLGGIFQWCVKQSSQVENLMTSTERIVEYCNLDPEPESQSNTSVTRGWPKYGIITAEGASFAHHKSLPYVLKTMFFCIRASEKVGVIGRTGAGKSSLISAMFRTGKLMGTIRIDGVATSDIPLKTLRSSMSVIPQDPVLFSGSLRLNIDPFNEFEDPDIWEVLDEVQLKDIVFDLPSKLSTDVTEGGIHFSTGQRQLLCLARALLLRKKILFIDEAPSNTSNDTDALIQETIKDKFRDCTVITVAHRLNTIMDCDRIMVIKAGKIVQFDEPCELFKDQDGEFKRLVEQAGPVEAARLELLAKEAKELRQLIRERTQQTYPGCNVTRSKTREEIMEMFGSRVVYETSL